MLRAKSRAAVSFILFLFILMLAVPANAEKLNESSGKLKIICSMFPQYDFAKNIAGDRADVELLVKPGLDPHDFEPSPVDVKNLSGADIFIFTGTLMEPWTERILNVINQKNNKIIDASSGVELINHDPHIWLNLLNAIKMIDNILAGLCAADPVNSGFYKDNAEKYVKLLTGLDSEFQDVINNSKRDTLVFCGPFAASYFINKYNLKYVSAYDGENEPGMARILDVVKYINKNKIKYILYDELEPAEIAKSIAEQTGAELLSFHSAHNIKPPLKSLASSSSSASATYMFYDIMCKNLEAVRLALN